MAKKKSSGGGKRAWVKQVVTKTAKQAYKGGKKVAKRSIKAVKLVGKEVAGKK